MVICSSYTMKRSILQAGAFTESGGTAALWPTPSCSSLVRWYQQLLDSNRGRPFVHHFLRQLVPAHIFT